MGCASGLLGLCLICICNLHVIQWLKGVIDVLDPNIRRVNFDIPKVIHDRFKQAVEYNGGMQKGVIIKFMREYANEVLGEQEKDTKSN